MVAYKKPDWGVQPPLTRLQIKWVNKLWYKSFLAKTDSWWNLMSNWKYHCSLRMFYSVVGIYSEYTWQNSTCRLDISTTKFSLSLNHLGHISYWRTYIMLYISYLSMPPLVAYLICWHTASNISKLDFTPLQSISCNIMI